MSHFRLHFYMFFICFEICSNFLRHIMVLRSLKLKIKRGIHQLSLWCACFFQAHRFCAWGIFLEPLLEEKYHHHSFFNLLIICSFSNSAHVTNLRFILRAISFRSLNDKQVNRLLNRLISVCFLL